MKQRTDSSVFLTDVAFSDEQQQQSSDNGDGAVESLAPLAPFRIPPMPRTVFSHPYVSVNYLTSSSNTATSHTLLEWEKQMILARLQKGTQLNPEAFQKRLSATKKRNERKCIREVCEKAEELTLAGRETNEAAFLLAEKHRNFVFYKYKHLKEIRQRQHTLTRAKKWYTIVVCHVFLAALMQERRVQEALDTFSFLMAPMMRRFLALRQQRKAAAELTKRHLHDIPFPFPDVIQSMNGTFFNDWPPALLEKLVEKSKPHFLRKGCYLMHEGDIGRVMFMITRGTLSIVLRKKGSDKRRTKENSIGVFEVKAPCYVGEFALVCKEPRSASIICETDVGYWAVSPEEYEEVARYLSPAVASKQREATDVRRRQNLKRFFPLHVAFLHNFPYFSKFSDASLSKLIDSVEPIVLHNGDFLFREGEMDSSMYFIQDGEAVMRDHDGTDHKVSKGSCIGVFECSCGVNEPKRSSIVSVNYCDIWRLSRETLIEVGMGEPAALLHCRSAAKKDRALEMRKSKEALQSLKKDPYMWFCCPGYLLSHLFEASVPTVFLNGERLALMGQTLSSLAVVVRGVLDITMARNDEKSTFRVHVTAGALSNAALQSAFLPYHGLSRVIGAYEFTSLLSQYACTVTSVGLTEAFVIERAQWDKIVPSQLRNVLHENVRSRECVSRAFKRRNAALLYNEEALSIARLYREAKLNERDTHK